MDDWKGEHLIPITPRGREKERIRKEAERMERNMQIVAGNNMYSKVVDKASSSIPGKTKGITREEYERAFAESSTQREVAERLGIAQSTVWQRKKDYGLKLKGEK